MLGRALSEEELVDCFAVAGKSTVGYVTLEEFAAWYNSESCNPELSVLKKTKMAVADQVEGSGALFG